MICTTKFSILRTSRTERSSDPLLSIDLKLWHFSNTSDTFRLFLFLPRHCKTFKAASNYVTVAGNHYWTFWKSSIGTQGDSFQLKNFKVAHWNFLRCSKLWFGWVVNFCEVRWKLVWTKRFFWTFDTKRHVRRDGMSKRHKSICGTLMF